MRNASTLWTRRALAAGTALSATCFLVALALDLLGRSGTGGHPSDLVALAGSLSALEPWGWATLGTLAIIVTPAASLVATALEYRRAADGRTALTAVAVLGVLGVSMAVAILRQV